MLKKSYLLSVLLIALLALAACGTTTNEKDDVGEDTNPSNEEQGDQQTDGIEEDTEGDANKEDKDTVDRDNQGTEDTDEQEDEKGDDDTANAPEDMKQVDSDEQNYTMAILPEFTLTSEEPGRDSLYLTEDGSIFMRVETEAFNQETYDFLKDNTVDLLQATSADQKEPTEITDENQLPQGEGIENTVGYTTETAEGITSGIVFKKDELVVRLTIFEPIEGNYYDQFIKMGQTITSK